MALTAAPGMNIHLPAALKCRLQEIHTHALTLIEAGPGFGKTTAISVFLSENAGRNQNAHWLSLYGEEPELTWKNLCALIAKADPVTAGYMGKYPLPTLNNLSELSMLFEELNTKEETLLIIDNYQLAGFAQPMLVLEALAHHSCDKLHIVVLSQPLKNESAAGKARIHSIGHDCFLFQPKDISQLFKLAGMALNAAQVQAVSALTEGWIAALALQMVHFASHKGFDSQYGINDLIKGSIWNRLSADEKDFLTALFLFDSFTKNQAAVLCGQLDLQIKLDALLDGLVFIHLDENAGRYSLHGLLRAFISGAFEALPQAKKRHIYSAIATAFLEGGEPYFAAKAFGKAGDYSRILPLAISDAELVDLVRTHSEDIVRPMLEYCTENKEEAHCLLITRFALELLFQGRLELFSMALSHLEWVAAQDDPKNRAVKGDLELIHSFTLFNDIAAMAQAQKKAHEWLQGPTKLLNPESEWTFCVPSVVSLYWHESGALQEHVRQMASMIKYYYALTQGNGSGAEYAMEAEALLLAGDENGAEASCYKAMYLAQTKRQDCILFCVELSLARIAILRGDGVKLQELLDSIKRRGYESHESNSLTSMELCMAYISYVLGRPQDMPAWLSSGDEANERGYAALTATFSNTLHAGLLISQNENEYIGKAELLLEEARQSHMLLPVLHHLIELSIVRSRRSEFKEALLYLKQALDIALPDRVYLPFAQRLEALEPLLQTLPAAYKEKTAPIIALGRRQAQGVQKVLSLLYPSGRLTRREKEIALLVKEGLTAKQIAEMLFISPSTVRNTMQKIYVKLGVHSNMELSRKKL